MSADMSPYFSAPFNCSRRIQLTTQHQSVQSMVFPHYSGVFKKIRIKTPTATRLGRYVHSPPLVSIARERLGSTTSKNATAQQAQGEHNFYYFVFVSVSALREFWITRFGMLTY